MENLLKQKRILKGKITRLENGISTALESGTLDNIRRNSFVEQATKLMNDVDSLFNGLLCGCKDEDFSDFEEEFHDLLGNLDELKIKVVKEEAQQNPNTCQRSTINLPKIDLPSFYGNSQDWLSFHDLYVATIHSNDSLSKAQKLQYLKLSLKKEAETILKSIQITDSNYDKAWGVLKERFDNKTEMVYAHLERLFNQPLQHQESASGLQKLIDTTVDCLETLKSLDEPTQHWNSILVYFIRRKLDPETLRQWEMSQDTNKLATFTEFKQFLDNRARALATLGINKPKFSTINKPQKINPSNKFYSTAHFSDFKANNCIVCNQRHQIYSCQEFLNQDINVRKEVVKKYLLCWNCLRPKHQAKNCKSRRCKKCNKGHHTLLHEDEVQLQASPINELQEVPISHSSNSNEFTRTLLPTVLVKIVDTDGNIHTCRGLIDSGSQLSFVREDCVQRLKLKCKPASINITGVSSSSVGTSKGMVDMKLLSFSDSHVTVFVKAFVLPKITCNLPQNSISSSVLKSFKHLKLADPSCHETGPIDILLGADVFAEIFLCGRQASSNGSLFAQETVFGWIVSGETNHETIESKQNEIANHHASFDVNLELRRFWELEEVPYKKFLTEEEMQCEKHFQSTFTRDKFGRYVVRLPFHNSTNILGASRDRAIARQQQMERRLNRQPEHASMYKSFMQEYLDLGHMELISQTELNNPSNCTYYLPHHAVVKKLSKFRVVFDASAKSSTGLSLNDMLLVEPTLQDGLIPLLLRFRMHQIVMIADIVKMYRQIRIHSSDANYQRIVWRSGRDQQMQDYRLLTVTYGTASAPYLATKCLQQLAEDEKEDFPVASTVLKRDFYVDDLMTGTNNLQDAFRLVHEIIHLLRRGGFEIKKWMSNREEILQAIPPDYRQNSMPLNIKIDDSVKALGILWYPVSDEFSFKLQVNTKECTVTKRFLLSNIAKLFDPMGWLSPVTIKCKILMQQLWKLHIEWDEPEVIYSEWITMCQDLSTVETIKIPRCILRFTSQIELHGYSDASEEAFSAVVYLHSLSETGEVNVQIVMFKTKVAPIKTVSLPRLELCGALLLSKLVEFVRKTLTIHSSQVHYWTDSTIVLSWIASHPGRWKTFVANRVAEIQTLSSIHQWHHVASEDNPADCASRGISTCALKSLALWWNGPSYLHKKNILYKKPPIENIKSETIEQRPNYLCSITSTESADLQNQNEFYSIVRRFSSLLKLKRVVAYCLRFVNNAKRSRIHKSGFLSTDELNYALHLVIKGVQTFQFATEIDCIRKNKPLSCRSSILCLNPFLDKNGLLRVGGRLQNAIISYDKKYPILLPKNGFLTELIVAHAHVSHLHAGPQLMLAYIQQKFWILSARDVIRRCCRKCITCLRYRINSTKQLMGNLPVARVNKARAFLQCGVDYAGPISLRASKGRGYKSIKGYIAIFVCFVTRAMHLELVSDLFSEAFIAALKRFIARRGKCSDIHSDCGTNFIGAQRKLKDIVNMFRSASHNAKVSHYLGDEGINWHFNPPASPHLGGIWEAGVKSVKYHLRRIIGHASLTFEEMYTVLVQIEACLNSRPLCPMSSDPNDLTALTPGHFLIGDALTALPEVDYTSTNTNRLNRWQLLQRIFQHFWKRWASEYLTRLQQRPKWVKAEKDLQIGDLVLLKDERLPPHKWNLGRIIETFPGSDNHVRVVKVKTADGFVTRSITKLCQLPVDN